MPTLLAGALADLGDGLLPAALRPQAGGAQLAPAGVGDAVAAAHGVAGLAHAHAAHPRAAGCCPGFTLPPLAALHALHARRAVPPAGTAAPARLALAAGAHRAAAAGVAGLAQRAAPRGQGRAGGRLAGAAGVGRGGRGEGQEQEQQPGGAEEQGAQRRPLHGGARWWQRREVSRASAAGVLNAAPRPARPREPHPGAARAWPPRPGPRVLAGCAGLWPPSAPLWVPLRPLLLPRGVRPSPL